MYILDYYWENSEIYFLRCLHIYRNIYYIVLVSHTHATRTEDSKSKQRVDIEIAHQVIKQKYFF